MIPRTLEPEVMDTPQEAEEYDSMDHSEVNHLFVSDFLAAFPDQILSAQHEILDLGTGTALIPIELCRQQSAAHILGIDLADEMLKRAAANVNQAGLENRIRLQKCDAKTLPCDDASFAAVISNSIIHHIPEPMIAFREMVRVLKPGGILFLRDLLRPAHLETLESLVAQYAGEETEYSRQLFRQSLHAALTLEEVQSLLRELQLPEDSVLATSDRHWTVSLTKQ